MQLRQRRRQQWHAKRALRVAKRKHPDRVVKPRATLDGGVFPRQLNEPRRLKTIAAKLKVVKMYNDLMEEKKKTMEQLAEPNPIGATRADLKQFFERKKQLKKKLKYDVQKECKKAFPDTVGSTKVCKWKARSERECWADLPAEFAARATATTNAWRKKIQLGKKGRRPGSHIPLQIQKELDMLMMEMTSGLSDVSERKELIDTESLVLYLHSERQLPFNEC